MNSFRELNKALRNGTYLGVPTETFLYGSRSKLGFFYAAEEPDLKDSDWDVAIPANKFISEKLSLLGWEEKKDLAYQDDFTKEIWEMSFGPELKIQISMKDEFDRFCRVWDNVSSEFYWEFLNKRSKTYIGPEGVAKLINHFKWMSHIGKTPAKKILVVDGPGVAIAHEPAWDVIMPAQPLVHVGRVDVVRNRFDEVDFGEVVPDEVNGAAF